MVQKRCLICGKKQKTVVLYQQNFNPQLVNTNLFSARRIPDHTRYQINKCLKCGLIFSSPILEENKILSLYKNSNLNYDDLVPYISYTYSFYINKFLPKIPDNYKILDIGCGNGFFLEEARKLGFKNVYGIEPSKKAVDKAKTNIRKNIEVNFFKKGIFPKFYFNVITCFHTLDHISNPGIFIRITYEILKNKGFAYFVVHDTDGLSVKLFGEKSAIFDIEHIYLFNKITLRKIFLKYGFKKVEVFDIKNKYPLKYWIHMIPIPLLFKNYILTVLKWIKLENMPLTIKAGNIAVIAYKI